MISARLTGELTMRGTDLHQAAFTHPPWCDFGGFSSWGAFRSRNTSRSPPHQVWSTMPRAVNELSTVSVQSPIKPAMNQSGSGSN